MKTIFVRLSLLVAVILAISQTAWAQFQGQDNYWLQQTWTHGLSLPTPDFQYGMVIDSTGRVYVATGSQIVVFDPSGVLTQSWNVANVQDVSLYPGSNLLFMACYNTLTNQIKVYDTSGNFIRQWGNPGTATGQLYAASSVAVGPDGLVYVADPNINRIDVFDTFGNLLRTWGTNGVTGGQFNSPRHVSVGPSNSVYVADFFNDRVQAFDTQGNFLWQYQSSGWTPKGLWIPPDGAFVYAMDSGTSSTGYRWLTPNGAVINSFNATVIRGAAWSVDGQYVVYLTPTQINFYRRVYRTAGTIPPNAIPLPTLLGVAQRPGTGFIDIDYSVIDPDNTNVQVGAVALNNGRTDLGGMISMVTFAEGTGVNVGTNISTGQRHHLTWNAGVDWPTNSGSVAISILANDYRGLLDFHFITIPSNATYATPLVINQSPFSPTDLLGVWTWLVATSNTNILLQSGNVYGTGGTYSNVLLAQTTGTTSTTTPAGRAFLWSLMNVREATTNELFRAATGTTGKVTQWTPRVSIAGLPGKVNEYSFDTSAFSPSLPFVPVTNVWWPVLSP